MDLKPHAKGVTHEGLVAVVFDLRLSEEGIKTQRDLLEGQDFWKVLEQNIRDYNQEHGFHFLDLNKPEFAPIR